MAIKIIGIISNSGNDNICLVRHGDLEFSAEVDFNGALEKDSEYFFEMGYEAIEEIVKVQIFEDSMSGIFPTSSENELCVVGRVSGIFRENNIELIDLYIQRGPEFITIDRKDIPIGNYDLHDGVKIVFKNLKFYAHDKM